MEGVMVGRGGATRKAFVVADVVLPPDLHGASNSFSCSFCMRFSVCSIYLYIYI